MATPQHGGTNGVAEIDIGQTGSARRTAGTAFWSGNVLEGGEEATHVYHNLAQQNIVYRDVLGFSGRRVTWRGNLKVNNDAMIGTIEADLAARKHGGLGSPSPGLVRETRLTNSYGRVLSERAVLEDYRLEERVRTLHGSGTFTILVPLTLEFRCLG